MTDRDSCTTCAADARTPARTVRPMCLPLLTLAWMSSAAAATNPRSVYFRSTRSGNRQLNKAIHRIAIT